MGFLARPVLFWTAWESPPPLTAKVGDAHPTWQWFS